jgi:hypothetical protein
MGTPEEPQRPLGFVSRHKVLIIVIAVVVVIVLCVLLCAQGSGDNG